MKYAAAFLALLLLLPAAPSTGAVAHPADEFFQIHQLKLTAKGVELDLYLFPGPLVARQIWQDADADRDGQVSADEAAGFTERLLPKLYLSLEQQESLSWTIITAEFPAAFQPLQIGDEGIYMQLQAAWPAGTRGARWIELSNDNYVENGRFWFDVAATEGVSLGRHHTERNRFISEFSLRNPAPGTGDNPAGEPAATGDETPAAEAGRQAREARSPWLQQLDALLRAPSLTPQFFAVALLVALVLGALHALTPGHGKTVVAAYLVGSRGTIGHAAFLGGIVTLTHTGSVLLLGVLAVIASRAIIPSRLTPLLELASGLLILALGLNLLWARFRASRHPATHSHSHTHDHSHHHDHDHTHEHGHDHGHSHHIPDPSEISWRSLLALGVSGGLVPCPDAIAILLIAVAIQRLLLGLVLILAFSAGLAAVLIAIGVALVTGKGLLARRFERFEPATRWLPLVSAVIVTGLGLLVALRAATSL